jgi:pimeloyl-ACP methyl ester carboxylesterase
MNDARELTAFRVTARTQQAAWDSLGDYDLRSRLGHGASHPPCRVLHGTFDPMPIDGSRELAPLLAAELVELPTGHCPHVEATDAFVRALDDFLPRA